MLATNQILHKGRYRIINSFASDETGGMYEAYDTVSNTNVVLRESVGGVGKVITSNQLEAINAEFAGGAKALTEIKHESLVSVQDYFSEIDRQYLVLEVVTGFDLTKFLEAGASRPSLSEVLAWADQLLGALNHLHKLVPPIIHRDIRPENIKLTSSEKVKLLTAATGFSSGDRSNKNAVLNYQPLEQLWAGLDPASQRVVLHGYDERSESVLMQPLDPRSDLYSVAASLYHVLTGALPCDALERSIEILDGKTDPLRSPADIDPSIPPEVSDVFMRAMSVKREERFDSAVIMLQVLRTSMVRVDERKAHESEAPEAASPLIEATIVDEPTAEGDMADVEARLEQERVRADARRREIEAERERLEQEQVRIEKLQQELEAEKVRQKAARQQAQLEAEEERKRIEEARLTAEAEEKLRQERALEAGRREAEEKRLAAKAAEEKAAQQVQQRSDKAPADLDDDDQILLEIGIEQPASERRVVPQADPSEDSILMELDKPSAPSWQKPAIAAGAAALLLVAAIVGWQFMSTAKVAPLATMDRPAAETRESVQPPAPQTADQTQVQPVETTTDQSAVSTTATERNRQAQLSLQAEKNKKAATAVPAKTPPPAKKKITVDDLINDN